MIPMMNTYDTIRENLHFNKFTVGELLFVEYKCPIEQEAAGVWTPMDYFIHVLSGKKTWRTTDGTWIAEKDQTLFFKKGAAVVYQDFKVQAARYHPLPESDQIKFSGEYLLRD